MLKIRLARMGKKNYPLYRVVVSDHTKTPKSEALEILGRYNPNTDPATLELEVDRIKHWLSVGASYSDTVGDLLAKQGIIEKKKIDYTSKHPKKSKKAKAKEAEEAEKEAEKKPETDAKPEEKKDEKADAPEKKETEKKEDAKPEEKPSQDKQENK